MKKKTPKLNLLDSSSRFANCIFPLEEKGKGRRRRRKKKGHPGRENRTRTWARKKGWPRGQDPRIVGSYTCTSPTSSTTCSTKSVRVENLILAPLPPLGDSMIRREGRRSEENPKGETLRRYTNPFPQGSVI